LYILIKELKYNNTINAKYFLDCLGENKAILELTDEQIIENIMGNDKEDNVKDDNSILELVSYKDTLKATIILH
jgi:succinate dehydrogenase flavin-adding protein (antitoxin of CptAB toxin-antitoxin module)